MVNYSTPFTDIRKIKDVTSSLTEISKQEILFLSNHLMLGLFFQIFMKVGVTTVQKNSFSPIRKPVDLQKTFPSEYRKIFKNFTGTQKNIPKLYW